MVKSDSNNIILWGSNFFQMGFRGGQTVFNRDLGAFSKVLREMNLPLKYLALFDMDIYIKHSGYRCIHRVVY